MIRIERTLKEGFFHCCRLNVSKNQTQEKIFFLYTQHSSDVASLTGRAFDLVISEIDDAASSFFTTNCILTKWSLLTGGIYYYYSTMPRFVLECPNLE